MGAAGAGAAGGHGRPPEDPRGGCGAGDFRSGSLPTHRRLVQEYKSASEAEGSLARLADMYDDVRRYDLAAQALFDLA